MTTQRCLMRLFSILSSYTKVIIRNIGDEATNDNIDVVDDDLNVSEREREALECWARSNKLLRCPVAQVLSWAKSLFWTLSFTVTFTFTFTAPLLAVLSRGGVTMSLIYRVPVWSRVKVGRGGTARVPCEIPHLAGVGWGGPLSPRVRLPTFTFKVLAIFFWNVSVVMIHLVYWRLVALPASSCLLWSRCCWSWCR